MLKNKFFILFALLVALYFLLSYRLLQVPMGLTVDESAFGVNAAYLSRTAHDENGKFLPLFVSSINNSDWRQPWTQYYLTLFFKIFGVSIFNLRLSSVILILFSSIILYQLVSKMYNWKYALISILIFVFTPIVFMHSHLGLDNIMPLPFTLIWLYYLYLYSQKRNKRFLIYSALALGSSFYTYKGMRAVVPVWASISFFYLLLINYQPKIKIWNLLKKTFPFVLAILPFFLIIPYLSHLYPGAIFGGARPKMDSIYNLAYAYLSHFDFNFLFIKGDALLFHSTQIHGMLLLSTLPIFLIGLYQSIRKRSFSLFVVITFFSAPLLYGLVDSIYRASRIICIVPSYVLICVCGISYLSQKIKYKKTILFLTFSLIFINFLSFLNYYWYTYPKFTENIFGNMSRFDSYQVFATESKKRNLPHYVDQDIYESFFDAICFSSPSTLVESGELPPAHSLYLTPKTEALGFQKLEVNMPHFNLLQSP